MNAGRPLLFREARLDRGGLQFKPPAPARLIDMALKYDAKKNLY